MITSKKNKLDLWVRVAMIFGTITALCFWSLVMVLGVNLLIESKQRQEERIRFQKHEQILKDKQFEEWYKIQSGGIPVPKE